MTSQIPLNNLGEWSTAFADCLHKSSEAFFGDSPSARLPFSVVRRGFLPSSPAQSSAATATAPPPLLLYPLPRNALPLPTMSSSGSLTTSSSFSRGSPAFSAVGTASCHNRMNTHNNASHSTAVVPGAGGGVTTSSSTFSPASMIPMEASIPSGTTILANTNTNSGIPAGRRTVRLVSLPAASTAPSTSSSPSSSSAWASPAAPFVPSSSSSIPSAVMTRGNAVTGGNAVEQRDEGDYNSNIASPSTLSITRCDLMDALRSRKASLQVAVRCLELAQQERNHWLLWEPAGMNLSPDQECTTKNSHSSSSRGGPSSSSSLLPSGHPSNPNHLLLLPLPLPQEEEEEDEPKRTRQRLSAVATPVPLPLRLCPSCSAAPPGQLHALQERRGVLAAGSSPLNTKKEAEAEEERAGSSVLFGDAASVVEILDAQDEGSTMATAAVHGATPNVKTKAENEEDPDAKHMEREMEEERVKQLQAYEAFIAAQIDLIQHQRADYEEWRWVFRCYRQQQQQESSVGSPHPHQAAASIITAATTTTSASAKKKEENGASSAVDSDVKVDDDDDVKEKPIHITVSPPPFMMSSICGMMMNNAAAHGSQFPSLSASFTPQLCLPPPPSSSSSFSFSSASALNTPAPHPPLSSIANASPSSRANDANVAAAAPPHSSPLTSSCASYAMGTIPPTVSSSSSSLSSLSTVSVSAGLPNPAAYPVGPPHPNAAMAMTREEPGPGHSAGYYANDNPANTRVFSYPSDHQGPYPNNEPQIHPPSYQLPNPPSANNAVTSHSYQEQPPSYPPYAYGNENSITTTHVYDNAVGAGGRGGLAAPHRFTWEDYEQQHLPQVSREALQEAEDVRLPVNPTSEYGGEGFPWSQALRAMMKDIFGLHGYRLRQLEIMNACMAGRDVLVLLPTGGGKSLCYQLPALMPNPTALTIVVSPLISLIQDQVYSLTANDVPSVELTGQTKEEVRRALYQEWRSGQILHPLVYVTPEYFGRSDNFIEKLSDLSKRHRLLNRFVIDEAHCVSQWGHDFRPDYRKLSALKHNFPSIPITALTATATEAVQQDVIKTLALHNAVVFKGSFNRHNLQYSVQHVKGDLTRLIPELIKKRFPGKTCGIVYCFSRKDCENMAAGLQKAGIRAGFYHAEAKSKVLSQEQWTRDSLQVMCATIAFGMGINKPDVRFVIHAAMPKSIEGFYQESGRAGRDGLPSECILLCNSGDRKKHHWLMQHSNDQESQLVSLNRMMAYTLNDVDCRRFQQLHHFGEEVSRQYCLENKRARAAAAASGGADHHNSTSTAEEVSVLCDNCASRERDRWTVKELEVTAILIDLAHLLQYLGSMTGKQLLAVYRGSAPSEYGKVLEARIREKGPPKEYKSGAKYPKLILERVLLEGLGRGLFHEKIKVVNDFAGGVVAYVNMGSGSAFGRTTNRRSSQAYSSANHNSTSGTHANHDGGRSFEGYNSSSAAGNGDAGGGHAVSSQGPLTLYALEKGKERIFLRVRGEKEKVPVPKPAAPVSAATGMEGEPAQSTKTKAKAAAKTNSRLPEEVEGRNARDGTTRRTILSAVGTASPDATLCTETDSGGRGGRRGGRGGAAGTEAKSTLEPTLWAATSAHSPLLDGLNENLPLSALFSTSAAALGDDVVGGAEYGDDSTGVSREERRQSAIESLRRTVKKVNIAGSAAVTGTETTTKHTDTIRSGAMEEDTSPDGGARKKGKRRRAVGRAGGSRYVLDECEKDNSTDSSSSGGDDDADGEDSDDDSFIVPDSATTSETENSTMTTPSHSYNAATPGRTPGGPLPFYSSSSTMVATPRRSTGGETTGSSLNTTQEEERLLQLNVHPSAPPPPPLPTLKAQQISKKRLRGEEADERDGEGHPHLHQEPAAISHTKSANGLESAGKRRGRGAKLVEELVVDVDDDDDDDNSDDALNPMTTKTTAAMDKRKGKKTSGLAGAVTAENHQNNDLHNNNNNWEDTAHLTHPSASQRQFSVPAARLQRLKTLLFTELEDLVHVLAEKSEGGRSYNVLPKRTLHAIVDTLETPGWGSVKHFMDVEGLGKNKVRKFGVDILQLYRRFRFEYIGDVKELSEAEKAALQKAASTSTRVGATMLTNTTSSSTAATLASLSAAGGAPPPAAAAAPTTTIPTRRLLLDPTTPDRPLSVEGIGATPPHPNANANAHQTISISPLHDGFATAAAAASASAGGAFPGQGSSTSSTTRGSAGDAPEHPIGPFTPLPFTTTTTEGRMEATEHRDSASNRTSGAQQGMTMPTTATTSAAWAPPPPPGRRTTFKLAPPATSIPPPPPPPVPPSGGRIPGTGCGSQENALSISAMERRGEKRSREVMETFTPAPPPPPNVGASSISYQQSVPLFMQLETAPPVLPPEVHHRSTLGVVPSAPHHHQSPPQASPPPRGGSGGGEAVDHRQVYAVGTANEESNNSVTWLTHPPASSYRMGENSNGTRSAPQQGGRPMSDWNETFASPLNTGGPALFAAPPHAITPTITTITTVSSGPGTSLPPGCGGAAGRSASGLYQPPPSHREEGVPLLGSDSYVDGNSPSFAMEPARSSAGSHRLVDGGGAAPSHNNNNNNNNNNNDNDRSHDPHGGAGPPAAMAWEEDEDDFLSRMCDDAIHDSSLAFMSSSTRRDQPGKESTRHQQQPRGGGRVGDVPDDIVSVDSEE